MNCTVDTVTIEGGYSNTGLFAIKYGLLRFPLLKLRHMNFLGPPGVPRGSQGGLRGGLRGVQNGDFKYLSEIDLFTLFFSKI